ncbi:MAG: hypothetical protein R3Y08_07660 [Rikenellaceae bacterium]
MEYYDSNNRAPIRWAALATLLYLLTLALLMAFVSFTTSTPDDNIEGILVEFGDDEFGTGEEELVATDVTTAPKPEPLEEVEEELLTDPNSEADVAVEEPEEKPKEEPKEVERVVNQNALFPGRKEQSTSTSQGSNDSSSKGNQGSQSGVEGGATSTTEGEGNSASFQLTDRSVVGSLPKPNYNINATGKVVINITVDLNGVVTGADYKAEGSTTNNTELIEAARAAALKAKFTVSDNPIQGGTITYVFTMD